MPQTGYCTGKTCNDEFTQLYECHCCDSFVCVNHLLEHIDISKRTSERFKLRNELTSASSTLQTIVEKKIHEIELEKQLINQAKAMLDMLVYPIDELESVHEAIVLTILSNRKEETVVKVEPSLSDGNISICNSEISLENHARKILTPNSSFQQAESPMVTDTTNLIGDSQTIDADDEELQQIESSNPRVFVERCSFEFDEPISLTTVPNSILLPSKSQAYKPKLIHSLKNKREGKQIHYRRSLRAASGHKHLQTTKVFDKSKDIINRHRRTVICPLNANMNKLHGYCKKRLNDRSCHCSLLMNSIMKHLKNYHRMGHKLAKRIFDDYKQYCTEIVSPLNNNPQPYRSVA